MPSNRGTQQRKTRYKYTLEIREKGKIPLSHYFYEYKTGDIVGLKILSSVQKGRFYPRFHGRAGVVTGRRGFCYEVKIKEDGKEKTLYVHPIHLRKQA